jgi:threonylcarbamoyladenosine tRNA methylthiotransferase MtaB
MATPVSVSFHTLGCKLNFAETSAIKQQFESAGYHINSFDDGADVCVINTCSVTDFADRKCRKAVRQALSKNSDSKIVVIGCYAQLKPTEIAEIKGVDLVLGAGEKFNIINYLDRLDKVPGKGWIRATDISAVEAFTPAFSYGDRTRSFLKIQDGCDYNCSFCTIPQARGKSRSDSIKSVVDRAVLIAEKGVKEIVLTGVNIGDFKGGDAADKATHHQFVDLIQALENQSSVPRFRISSIEPNLCTDTIIEFVSESTRFMPHFHMPLQSGNNKQLALMRRRYRRELYQERVDKIRALMPHACIGADVIVGFPGETMADFETTVQFIRNLSVDYLHVFTYSERANTLAAEMPGVVPIEERRQRNQLLREVSSGKQLEFYRRHLSTSREVLLEKGKRRGTLLGFTDNYIKVEVLMSDPESHINQVYPIFLDKIDSNGVVKGIISSEVKAGC